MLNLEEFKVSRFYHAPQPKDEDECQDPAECRKLLRKDQEEKYAIYVAQHEPKDVRQQSDHQRLIDAADGARTRVNKYPDEKRIELELAAKTKLRNKDSDDSKSRAEYFQEYRKRSVKCPKCGHQFHSLRRV